MASYRTNEEFTSRVYDLVKNSTIENVSAFIISAAEDPEAVVALWIGVQCDINNIKKDPCASEKVAWPGVDYALQNDQKKKAAGILHNIGAFYSKDWDLNVDPEVAPRILEASKRQVTLRRELSASGEDLGPLGWSLWDLGMAHLINKEADAAIESFNESVKVHESNSNENGVHWSKLFHGKTLLLHSTMPDEGREMMIAAANRIKEVGADWEREEIVNILQTAGIVL